METRLPSSCAPLSRPLRGDRSAFFISLRFTPFTTFPIYQTTMAVGGAFLSAFLQVLFDRLASKPVVDFIRVRDMEDMLKKLKTPLLLMKAVLDDAEEKQVKNEAVKMWLDKFKEVVYDGEDVLDEFATEALLRCMSVAVSQTSSNQVWNVISASLNPSVFLFNVDIESKIMEIMERVDELAKERFDLGLQDVAAAYSSRVLRETSSVVDESRIHGRDNDKEKIVELLLNDNSSSCCSDNEFSVIPIVGMCGIGKTALAQIAYNDKRVKMHFDLKAWVCVSDHGFDVKIITRKILESVTSKSSDFYDLNQIQLEAILTGKKFLIVLDDVWSKNYSSWYELQAPLSRAARGSMVLVTTRCADVALMMGTVEPHFLGYLSEDECWSVFAQHAFKHKNVNKNPIFLEIGKKFVEKCKGLPLAATTIGGLLRSKQEEDEWENILNSEIWDLPEEESNILPALRSSYYHLPSHVKRCFAYCSILPKGYEFGEREIVLLWMAEGFLQTLGGKQMEDVGREYFHDLLSRSFFQPSSSNKCLYVMHDLINDLARWVAGETCFKLDNKLEEGQKQGKISRKARHSSYIGGKYNGVKSFEAFNQVKSLRTFLPFMPASYQWCYLTYDVPFKLLPKLSCLRVLSVTGYYITELPNSICDLKHLRYLALSNTKIRRLPKTISNLFNLQTLMLKDCSHLENWPVGMGNLINLRHLDFTGAYLIEGMPQGIGGLTNLQTLSNFVVAENSSDCGIGELKKLSHLRGALFISGLENVVDAQEAFEAKLNDKQGIDVLKLEWSGLLESHDSHSDRVQDVLHVLRPHRKLKELTIKCYGGTGFPAWIGDPSFKHLVLLKFEKCVKCTALPPLGKLPLLRDLHINGMDKVERVDIGFYGEDCSKPFPSLETLCFEDMEGWKDWLQSGLNEQVEGFSCLRELSILRCPKLLGNLPDHFPSLEKLVIDECQQLVTTIPSSPLLCILEIKGCKGLVHKSSTKLDSLNSMVLSRILEFTCPTEGLMQACGKVEDLKIVGCEELWNEVCLEKHLQQGLPPLLREIVIRKCNALISLPRSIVQNNTCLERMYICYCDSMTSISRGQLPPTLKSLEISNCRNLKCILDDGEPSSSSSSSYSSSTSLLEYLYIGWCSSLTCLSPSGELPAALKLLMIWNCSELTSLSSCGQLPPTLKHLEIRSCPKLESMADRLHNNTSLEYIGLWDCDNLKSLPNGLRNLNHLHEMKIIGCPFVSFPEEGLPTNLRELYIISCEKLEALPNHMCNLSSLEKLEIVYCPGIVLFPEEGFPTNLTSLSITDLRICKPLLEWGLNRLTSLRELTIEGGYPELQSFPTKANNGMMMLPSTLTSLTIVDFPHLKYLHSMGFQNLSSLTSLSIQNLPNLECLSSGMFLNLTALEELSICNCLKLESFPANLPPSLLLLDIEDSLLLKQQCKKDKGQYWCKIAHIPCVQIDGRFVYDSEDED